MDRPSAQRRKAMMATTAKPHDSATQTRASKLGPILTALATNRNYSSGSHRLVVIEPPHRRRALDSATPERLPPQRHLPRRRRLFCIDRLSGRRTSSRRSRNVACEFKGTPQLYAFDLQDGREV